MVVELESEEVEKGGVVRASISFPPELLKEFEELAKKMGYRKRSQAICDAMRNFIIENVWKEEGGGVVGVMSFIYEHETSAQKLAGVEHDFNDIIISSTHVHLDKVNCLEVLVSRGPSERIRKLSEALRSLKGVKTLKLLTTGVVK